MAAEGRWWGRPYKISGRTYTPRRDEDYSREGLASWYGPGFHGRQTANGEVFDQHAVSAAHPTLPIPSYVRVTNLSNSRSLIVRVNDRGPFHDNRIIDVSKTVADALDFRKNGVARVKVDYVAPASTDGSDDQILIATLRDDGRLAQTARSRYPPGRDGRFRRNRNQAGAASICRGAPGTADRRGRVASGAPGAGCLLLRCRAACDQ